LRAKHAPKAAMWQQKGGVVENKLNKDEINAEFATRERRI